MKSMKTLPTKEQCEMVAQFLKVLAHPQRLMILCQLTGGPKTVGELEKLSGASQSAVSQFLNRMKLEKIVSSKRDSKKVYYEISDLRALKLFQAMHKIFCL